MTSATVCVFQPRAFKTMLPRKFQVMAEKAVELEHNYRLSQ